MPSPTSRSAPFFLLTFIITWGLQLPGVLAQRGMLSGEPSSYLPLAGLGIFGPLVATVVLTQREGGWRAVQALLVRVTRWRVSARWYFVALLPAALLCALLFLLRLGGRGGPIAYLPTAAGVVFGIVISVVEEIGWRGFALPRLEQRWGAFAASGLLGVAWYLWHIPMFIGQGVPLELVLVMLLYFCGASLLMTRISHESSASLLPVSVAHFAAHLNNSHRALPLDATPLVAHAIIYATMGLVLLPPPHPSSRFALRAVASSKSPAPRAQEEEGN
ncbi:MAG: CPBP family intramembrane glutamic endopeptidase [Myxococcota bacterium]